jgi:O-antigen/teichoic acid export membrane protein
MVIISPILLLIGISNVVGMQYLLPTKHQKEYTLSVVFGALVNFITNYFLIQKMGAMGAALGTVIAELIVTIIQLIYVRKDLDINSIILSSKQYFISSLIMFVFCILISNFITSNIWSVIVQIIVGGIVYFSSLLVMKNKFLFELINIVLSKLKK